jgi:hypothetical protein
MTFGQTGCLCFRCWHSYKSLYHDKSWSRWMFVFQTLALLQDHLQYLPLQSGFMAELKLIGVVSFDLSGQIQLSLWNRNAHSLVEKKYVYCIGVAMKC